MSKYLKFLAMLFVVAVSQTFASTVAGPYEIQNASGGLTPSNYLRLTGSTADNSNYPGIEFKGGTLATTYPNFLLSNGGLGLMLSGGSSATYSNRIQLFLGSNSPSNAYTTFQKVNGGTTTDLMVIRDSGYVGIGTSSPTCALTVIGTISAKEVHVTANGFPDYVFAKDYKLAKLSDVEKYIDENKHLPGIPSAAEVEKNGLGLAEIAKKQMEKIEELTLYMIELKKENEALKQRIEKIETAPAVSK